MWAAAPENVELDASTDLGTTGLVLDTSNSPATVTIDGSDRVIDLTGSATGSPLITVGAGVTLTLKNITFKGLKAGDGTDATNNNRYLIRVNGGTLILEDDAVISDNYRAIENAVGGGVYVYGFGELIMNGGAISNNHADWGGGGVYLLNNATFTMNGGAISGNTSSEYGGGVGVHNGSEFIMSGGTISNNQANWGGGVCIRGDGEFTMSDGTISGNTSSTYGGGVGMVDSGEFTMKGGTISGNTAASYGGGVGVAGGTFTKTGNSIIYGSNEGANSNTSNSGQGHAAYVADGGKKRDNTADTGDDLNSGVAGSGGGWE
jgi:hypothetical protein